MTDVGFEEVAGGVILAPPPAIRAAHKRAFAGRLSLKNEFNTGLGLPYPQMGAKPYAKFKEGLAKQGVLAPGHESTALMEFLWLNVSVESHVDEGFGRLMFFVWVLESRWRSKHAIRFDSRALFRYSDPGGKAQELRLTEGHLIAFNPRRAHELLFCGDEVRLAVGVAARIPKKTAIELSRL